MSVPVSRVLNNSSFVEEVKRDAVVEAIKTLRYQPNVVARSLVSGQTYTIGVVANDIGSPFNDCIAQGIAMELQMTKFSPIIVDGLWNVETEGEVVQSLVARSVDGIIFIGGGLPVEELEELNSKKPTLLVARELSSWQHGSIYIDNFEGAYKATKFLIEAGHREIAFIGGIKDRQDAIRRLDGFRQALSEHEIEFHEELYADSDFMATTAVAAMDALLAKDLPFTAVFCCNDQTAFGANHALSERGVRVPEDVSLVGFDDQHLSAFMSPPLTTVSQPARQLGRDAARTMIGLIGGDESTTRVIKPKLVVRKSVANR